MKDFFDVIEDKELTIECRLLLTWIAIQEIPEGIPLPILHYKGPLINNVQALGILSELGLVEVNENEARVLPKVKNKPTVKSRGLDKKPKAVKTTPEEPVFELSEPDTPLESLSKEELQKRLKTALKHPRAKKSQPIIKLALEHMNEAVNRVRKEHGYKVKDYDFMSKDKNKALKLLGFLQDEDATLMEFFEFAYKETRWQGNWFPNNSMMFGPWLKQKFEDRDETSDEGPSHAGSKYKTDSGLLPKLVEAGLWNEEWSEATLRFIVSSAEIRVHTPHLAEEDEDPATEEAICWVAANGEF